MVGSSHEIHNILIRIRDEYLEMPGLRLSARQACRLWGLEATACDALLGALVSSGFLAQTRDGAFVRADSGIGSRRLRRRETV